MHRIKVYISKENLSGKLPFGTASLIRRSCLAVLKNEGFIGSAEVNVSFVDGEVIRRINLTHRDKDSITDVLSFPLGEDGVYDVNPENKCYMLGDIVICFERAVAQAKQYGHSLKREISFLAVHSMLHLLGYDHVNNEQEEKEMFSKQKQIMSQLGINR